MYTNKVILLLGSNLGDRFFLINQAIEKISEFSNVVKKSEIIETEPWGYESENKFLNQALLIETNLSPVKLLKQLKEIESSLGRKNSTPQRYEDRTIDIDIVEFNDVTFISSRLVLPHENHLKLREFSQKLIFSLKNS